MFVGSIPGGRHAVVRYFGTDDTLRATANWLVTSWLPRSGHRARDGGLVFRRLRFFPDVPEHDAVTDVLLPLAPDSIRVPSTQRLGNLAVQGHRRGEPEGGWLRPLADRRRGR